MLRSLLCSKFHLKNVFKSSLALLIHTFLGETILYPAQYESVSEKLKINTLGNAKAETLSSLHQKMQACYIVMLNIPQRNCSHSHFYCRPSGPFRKALKSSGLQVWCPSSLYEMKTQELLGLLQPQ